MPGPIAEVEVVGDVPIPPNVDRETLEPTVESVLDTLRRLRKSPPPAGGSRQDVRR